MLLLLLQTASTVSNKIPEKQPALFTLIYMAGLLLVALLLLLSAWRFKPRRTSFLNDSNSIDIPEEVQRKLGATATNRGLRVLRWCFALLALVVFGFHIYWAKYAEEKNETFQALRYKDLRNRRLSESTLRGWILDRSGKLDKALALYQRDAKGMIFREYSMDTAFAHLFGSDRGDPGLERALFGVQSGMVPEVTDILRGIEIKQPANLDVRLTIDRELQKAAVDQLKGRHGAVVVVNPQTGEVLAMYSNPSYSLKEVQDEATWIRLEADKRDSQLVNRALGFYYVPGSTFKTVTMIAAYIAGQQDAEFLCTSSGYVAQPGNKPILDDGGVNEVHGKIGMGLAYEVSCNQYFAQLAVKLGPERMKEAAELLGIGAYDKPQDALAGRKQMKIWNVSTDAVRRALAPRESTMVTSKSIRPFDLALEGYGQGYASQMTPFQMALIAAAVGNMEGTLMKPKLEYNLPPVAYSRVTTPEKAADMRRIMGLVTGGPHGTARGVFGPVHAAGIVTGGKTGTAQKDVPVYDPKTGEVKTVKKYERDNKGNIIREYEQVLIAPEPRVDSWFLCIAPLERPQVAMAVVIEGGGYGSRAAAPVTAQMVLKAKELGLLGNLTQPNKDVPTNSNKQSNIKKQRQTSSNQ
jgi:penicillin-binding protein A